MRNMCLVLPLLVLTACQPANDKAATGEAIAEGAGLGDRPTGRSGDPVAKGANRGPIPANIDEGIEPLPAPVPAAPAALPADIPDQFRGRWSINAADCQGGAAAKGLLTIEDRRLVFYESRGVLERIDGNSPANVLTANYGFSGEGMEWQRAIKLERTGNKLRRTEQGGEEGPVDLTYTSCPG